MQAIAAAPLVATLPLAQANTGSRLVLGQSAAFNDVADQSSVQVNLGANLYFDQLNRSGGVNGQQIELRKADDGGDPETCLANTKNFIGEGVFSLFGYVGTATVMAALPTIVESKVPFFAPVSGVRALRDPLRRNIFHIRASYSDETAVAAKHMLALGLRRIAVYLQDDSYGWAGLDGIYGAMVVHNLRPVAIVTIPRYGTSVDAAVDTIADSRPDGIVLLDNYSRCAALIRAMRRTGYGGSFYNVSSVGAQSLASALRNDASGVVVSQIMPYPLSNSLPITREYLSAVKTSGGTVKPNYLSMEGYLAARAFVEGLKRGGRSNTRDGLINGLESMQNFDLGGFQVNFSPRNHEGSKFVDLSMLKLDGGIMR